MFQGEQIKALVELFEKRGVKLYHSAQYKDFKSYLHLGGIPSRALLSDHQMNMTSFDTDTDDKINEVWDKVFLNPTDFGNIMKKGSRGTPTVYGPITFEFQPIVLLDAEDVALCLRSAGGSGFNRQKESLKTVEDVERIFLNKYTEDYYFKHQNASIKSPGKLREEFKLGYASNPEISLTISGNCLTLVNKIIRIIVDPYVINTVKLVDLVRDQVSKHFNGIEIKERFWTKYYKIIPEIIGVLSNNLPTIEDLERDQNLSNLFREWIAGIREMNLGYQLERYMRYFREGTLLPIFDEIEENPLFKR